MAYLKLLTDSLHTFVLHTTGPQWDELYYEMRLKDLMYFRVIKQINSEHFLLVLMLSTCAGYVQIYCSSNNCFIFPESYQY